MSWLFVIVWSAAEDPSENYVKLRDFVLVKLCLTLPSFSSEKLSQGFSEEMVSEAREKLKINKVTLAGLPTLLFLSIFINSYSQEKTLGEQMGMKLL